MKIGFFDSGVGGLVIMKSVYDAFPYFEYVYFGDTDNMPFGEKSFELVRELTIHGIEFLIEQGAEVVVVACNTASATITQNDIDDWYARGIRVVTIIELSIASMVDADVVSILATRSTVQSHVWKKIMAHYYPEKTVFEYAAPLLASIVEEGMQEYAPEIINKYVDQAIIDNPDTMLLACTHYPLVKDHIRIRLPDVVVVSQDEVVVTSLRKILDFKESHNNSQPIIYVSYLSEHHQSIISKWFGDAKVVVVR
jgi:glutamate racemase